MYGRISDPGMGTYPSRVNEPQVGVYTPCRAVSTPGTTVFFAGLLEQMYGGISDTGMESYPPRVALVLRTPGWGFHTVWGGIDPRDHRFPPRFVGDVDPIQFKNMNRIRFFCS